MSTKPTRPEITLLIEGEECTYTEFIANNPDLPSIDRQSAYWLEVGESIHIGICEVTRVK